MIIGIGIDITEQQRISQAIDHYGNRFLQRIFTSQEIQLCQQRSVEHYAGKFAAKEAFMKAISSGFRQHVYFKDIEILNHSSGAPYINTYGNAHHIFTQLAITNTHLSISHSAGVAVAMVILERNESNLIKS